MNFAFNGSSVSLFSVDFGNPATFNASAAYYTIDGNPSISFVLPGSLNVSTTNAFENVGNYPLFTASDLSESPHDIEIVTSYAIDDVNPQYLAIQYFIVKTNPANSTSPANSSNPSSSPLPSSSPSTSSSASTHTNLGALVGGIVGGLVVLAALLGFLVYLRRRRRDSHSNMMLDLTGNSPSYIPSSILTGTALQATPFVHTTGINGTTDPSFEFNAYAGQSPTSSAPSGSFTHHPVPNISESLANRPISNRSSGWDPNRFITPKNAVILQVQNEQTREDEIRHHLDSGVRLSSAGRVVDVPPTYTEA
jgi:hypothetical protein